MHPVAVVAALGAAALVILILVNADGTAWRVSSSSGVAGVSTSIVPVAYAVHT